MTDAVSEKLNPWALPAVKGPAYGGPFSGSDIEHDQHRKEVYVLGKLVGFYIWDEDKWLWQPNDAS